MCSSSGSLAKLRGIIHEAPGKTALAGVSISRLIPMGAEMITKVKRFWRVLRKVTLWGLGGLAAYLVFSNIEKETAFWLAVGIMVMAVYYELQVILDKLDSIQGTLDDPLRDRGPPSDL